VNRQAIAIGHGSSGDQSGKKRDAVCSFHVYSWLRGVSMGHSIYPMKAGDQILSKFWMSQIAPTKLTVPNTAQATVSIKSE
jgi:hypothetical protein